MTAQSRRSERSAEISQLAGGIKANLSLLVTAPKQFDLILTGPFIPKGSTTIAHTSL